MGRIRVFMPCLRRRRRPRHTDSSRARAAAITSRTPPGPGATRGGPRRVARSCRLGPGAATCSCASRNGRPPANQRLGDVGGEQQPVGRPPLRAGRGGARGPRWHGQRRERAGRAAARRRPAPCPPGGRGCRRAGAPSASPGARPAARSPARLAAHELGDVRVLLLRHHRRPGRGVSASRAKPNSAVAHSTSSSARPGEVDEAAAAAKRSRARSRDRPPRRGFSEPALRRPAAAGSSRPARRPRGAGVRRRWAAAGSGSRSRASVPTCAGRWWPSLTGWARCGGCSQARRRRVGLGAVEQRARERPGSRHEPRRGHPRRRAETRRHLVVAERPAWIFRPTSPSSRSIAEWTSSSSGSSAPGGDLGEPRLRFGELGIVEDPGGVQAHTCIAVASQSYGSSSASSARRTPPRRDRAAPDPAGPEASCLVFARARAAAARPRAKRSR